MSGFLLLHITTAKIFLFVPLQTQYIYAYNHPTKPYNYTSTDPSLIAISSSHLDCTFFGVVTEFSSLCGDLSPQSQRLLCLNIDDPDQFWRLRRAHTETDIGLAITLVSTHVISIASSSTLVIPIRFRSLTVDLPSTLCGKLSPQNHRLLCLYTNDPDQFWRPRVHAKADIGCLQVTLEPAAVRHRGRSTATLFNLT